MVVPPRNNQLPWIIHTDIPDVKYMDNNTKYLKSRLDLIWSMPLNKYKNGHVQTN